MTGKSSFSVSSDTPTPVQAYYDFTRREMEIRVTGIANEKSLSDLDCLQRRIVTAYNLVEFNARGNNAEHWEVRDKGTHWELVNNGTAHNDPRTVFFLIVMKETINVIEEFSALAYPFYKTKKGIKLLSGS